MVELATATELNELADAMEAGLEILPGETYAHFLTERGQFVAACAIGHAMLARGFTSDQYTTGQHAEDISHKLFPVLLKHIPVLDHFDGPTNTVEYVINDNWCSGFKTKAIADMLRKVNA